MKHLILGAIFCAWAGAATAQTAAPAPAPALPPVSNSEQWPETWFEIFRLAPGQHEAFVRAVAINDEIGALVGQPPTRLYFHESGGEWDVLVLKVGGEFHPTPEQQAIMDARRAELGLPTGPAYFIDIRRMIAEHTDTHAIGPISAAQWLARLDEWRRQNPPQDESRSRTRRAR